MGLETIYDLASLTKPLCTGALLALLEARGVVDLDAPAERLLPGLACARGGRPTLMDLATHRAGLPMWRPFYLAGRRGEQIVEAALRVEPEAPCGARVLYSDPSYILLGEAVRRAAGRTLDALFRDWIAAPLGLGTLGFLPGPELRDRIALTENGNRFEARLAREVEAPIRTSGAGRGPEPARPGTGQQEEGPPGFPVRESIPAGEVHDTNTWAMGGVAGHAGLFGDALETARLAREFLGLSGGIFEARALDLFRENATPGLEEGRSLGFKLAVAGAREAQGALPTESFGHVGFTGTSVWLDPTRRRSYVLLTNRVHPEVRPIDINALRWRFHAIASKLS